MAFTFPLNRNAFFADVPTTEQTFDLRENIEVSGLADGSILRDDLGPRLWAGRCTIEHMTFRKAREIEAKLSLLQGVGASFFVWRLDCAYPAGDPDGSLVSGSSPVISALNANNRELKISGLPVGYSLGPGDMLSFAYGSSPTRYALHRIVSDAAVAGAGGETPYLEVVPHIRPGAVTSTAVVLARPYCKAVIVPGSVQPGVARGAKVRGLSFEFMQTLR